MIKKGSLLISEPYLGDDNFERTVILICENNEEGTVGFVLNRPTVITLESVVPDIQDCKQQVFVGGPVQQDSLHFIYRGERDFLGGSIEIADNLYWGGDYDQLISSINSGKIDAENFRFFLGYSGWGEGQLAEEMSKNSWIVANADLNDWFNSTPEDLWRNLLKDMGGKYKMYSNYPIDPRLN